MAAEGCRSRRENFNSIRKYFDRFCVELIMKRMLGEVLSAGSQTIFVLQFLQSN